MNVKIRMRPTLTPDAPARAYPIRPHSFLYSLGVHFVVIGSLALISSNPATPARPVYDELIRPQASKIIFYDFRKKLPRVAPREKIGDSILPRGTQIAKQAIIATSPKPVSRTQSIFVPAPKIELPKDAPIPDLVARNATSLPTLPPPPAPVRTPPKAFVPPPINRTPNLPISVPTVEASSPTLNVPAPPAPPVTANGLSALSRLAPPRPDAPPVPAATAGNASVDIAVANLNLPKNPNPSPPEGERPGQFSKAPEQGPAATGEAAPSTLTVPNLSIQEAETKPAKTPENNASSRTVVYAERVRNVPQATLSVPLRAATRSIPSAADTRFRGRNVYAIVIPIENMPVYTGDWIMWFAEREAKPGETPLMYAPIPLRKLESVEDATGTNRIRQRIQIAANLNKDGKLNNIILVTSVSPSAGQAVARDVASWEFKPARRNGIPIDVEVVMEIPFNLPLPTASNSLP